VLAHVLEKRLQIRADGHLAHLASVLVELDRQVVFGLPAFDAFDQLFGLADFRTFGQFGILLWLQVEQCVHVQILLHLLVFFALFPEEFFVFLTLKTFERCLFVLFNI